ncbi:MAG TPA: squalene synthase HpnC [Hyphomicrobiales bacterium]|nr:squalene synthase HpnC [Hyphomicrobiales bacterium]
MTAAADARSGKGHRDENFPVASHLIRARHRPAILAFYEFVRTADDIADHATLKPNEKLALLDGLEAALLGHGTEPSADRLRDILAERHLTPRHAQDLLAAFRLDVTKLRYADWDELIGYCRLSAMPVGRYVLDIHGEPRSTWVASDALCAALQVINHVQDCAKDHAALGRVYLPLDMLAARGASVEDLGEPAASPALRAALGDVVQRTVALLRDSAPLSAEVADWRLALEIAAIQRLAETLTARLAQHDPLSERVHLGKAGFAAVAFGGLLRGLAGRASGGGQRRATRPESQP